jgi:hypothetical protein
VYYIPDFFKNQAQFLFFAKKYSAFVKKRLTNLFCGCKLFHILIEAKASLRFSQGRLSHYNKQIKGNGVLGDYSSPKAPLLLFFKIYYIGGYTYENRNRLFRQQGL